MFKKRTNDAVEASHSCEWHPDTPAEGRCAQCLRSCCGSCTVQVRRDVWCADCALVAAGVRVRESTTRRELRREARTRRRVPAEAAPV